MEPIIIDHEALASYLLRPDLAEDDTAKVIDLTNRRIGEVIGDITDVPVEVESFALEVAARAVRPNLESSVTIASDGTSRTVRHENAKATGSGVGVYLTKTEENYLLQLIGLAPSRRRRRSIRTYVP